MAFPVKYFKGKINNKSAYEFLNELDFNLCQSDRIKNANKVLYTQNGEHDNYVDQYFETYFDEKFKVNLNQNDYISSDNNVCKILESMANYILFADDAEKVKKTEYNYYTRQQLENKFGKDLSIEELMEKTYGQLENANSISFLLNNGYNYKKPIEQIITSHDIATIQPVREYEDLKLIISKNLKMLRANKLNKTSQKKLVKLLKELKSDQIISKDKINGTIYFKAPLKDSTEIDYDKCDFTNPKHITALLDCNGSLLTDLGCLKYDLKNILKQTPLKINDDKILNLLFQGYTYNEIAKNLLCQYSNIQNKIMRISKNICKKYQDLYDDWYYTYICKGVYKKCSKCGEIKLKNNRMFMFTNTIKIYSSWCRKCFNEFH